MPMLLDDEDGENQKKLVENFDDDAISPSP